MGRRIGTFLSTRTAWLVQTHYSLTNTQSGKASLGVYGSGCAAAIDHRGYFLTAAHCLTTNRVYLILFDSQTNTSDVLRPTVVWRGDTSKGGPDLALLHVDTTLDHVFDWSNGDFDPGDPVMAVGLARGAKWGDFYGLAFLGGKVLGCRKLSGDGGESSVAVDVPIQPGDSGGPLLDPRGRLIGVTTTGFHPVVQLFLTESLFPNRVQRPDRKWLSDLIEHDAAIRAKSASRR